MVAVASLISSFFLLSEFIKVLTRLCSGCLFPSLWSPRFRLFFSILSNSVCATRIRVLGFHMYHFPLALINFFLPFSSCWVLACPFIHSSISILLFFLLFSFPTSPSLSTTDPTPFVPQTNNRSSTSRAWGWTMANDPRGRNATCQAALRRQSSQRLQW